MGERLLIFSKILNYAYFLSEFFWRKVYQIDLYLYFVPILKGGFGKDISILTIILRNALLEAKKM